MGRRPCCPKEIINKGTWSREEDETLSKYIAIHGEGKWQKVPQNAGLKRCGKSCRQRWLNYLKPGIKRGDISQDEEDMIIRLHRLLGNRWALIAKRLPGRTDNEIKNYWNTNLSKKLQKDEQKKTKQIHVEPEVPRPRRLKAVQYNKILEYCEFDKDSGSPSKKIDNEDSDDEASLTDFLIDFDENQLVVAADDESMIPQIEDHNKVGSTNSLPSSSSPSDHCQNLTGKFEPLDSILDVELKKMASFLGL